MELRDFALQTSVTVQWGEMDAFAHVNNASYVRWGESARMAYFEAVDFYSSGDYSPILGFQSIKYIAPVVYPDTVHIGTRVDEIRDDRFILLSHFFSVALGRLVAIQHHEIVVLNAATGARVEVPESLKNSISAFEEK